MIYRPFSWLGARSIKSNKRSFSSAVFKKTDLDCKQRRKLFDFFKKVFIENQGQLRSAVYNSNLEFITRLALNMVNLNIDDKDFYEDLKSKLLFNLVI